MPRGRRELLRKEPGLLVELKRWVAKEATDRGQILDDADLTEKAIFERLTRDLEFRSVATRLWQRHGYLVPRLNPDSEAAREHEVLFRERTRHLARADAEEGPPVEENGKKPEVKRTESCGGRECEESTPQRVPEQTREDSIEKPEVPNRPMMQTIADSESGGNPFSKRHKYEISALALTEPLLADGIPAQPANLTLTETPKAISAERKRVPAAQPRGNEEIGVPGRTRLLAKPSPYADIPSLYDMYIQASARPLVLQRFGIDVFRNGTPDSGSFPMDLPVGPDYVVGPGDGLAIDSDDKGEIQLTDALNLFCRKRPLFGLRFEGQHYDAGDRVGYLKANIGLALRDPQLRQPLLEYLSRLQA